MDDKDKRNDRIGKEKMEMEMKIGCWNIRRGLLFGAVNIHYRSCISLRIFEIKRN